MPHQSRLIALRRYPLPAVRLRFRSTELAVLKQPGADPILATAAFSNISHTLVLLSPQGGLIQAIPDANVGWAMQSDENGNLISGGSDLTRFDPRTGRFELLAHQPVAPEELWSACVTRRHIVMGSSTPRGTVAVFDRATGEVVKTFSPVHSHSFYTYRIVEAPDGMILVLSSAPRAVIGLLDPRDLCMKHVIPEPLADRVRVTGGIFLDDHTFFVMTENSAVLLRYPDFEPIASIAHPAGLTFGFKPCSHAGSVAAWAANRPWLLNRDTLEWKPLTDEPVGDPNPECAETCVAMAGLPDGGLVGVTDSTCTFWRLNPGDRRPNRRTIDLCGLTDGAPLAIGGGHAYGSSHAVQRFWSVNLKTGEGRDLGQCSVGGQANSMLWDGERSRLLMGTYPEAHIRVFDPNHPPSFPANPGTFVRLGANLGRVSHTLLNLGDQLWTTSSFAGIRLGGVLIRVRLDTREVRVYPEFVPHEKPGTLVHDPVDGTLFMGSTVQADCGQNIPVSTCAHLLAFDPIRESLTRCEAPIPGASTLSALCVTPDRRLLFLDGPLLSANRTLWAWHLPTGSFEPIGLAPDGLREILPHPRTGELWATAFTGLGPLILGDPCRVDLERGHSLSAGNWDQKMCKFLQWDPNDPDVLWCIQFTDLLCLRLQTH